MNEYENRKLQPLLVLAQQPFQLKLPPEYAKRVNWPGYVAPEALFDPASTVSASYGVAFQLRFRLASLSNRPAIFVIDSAGVIRHIASQPQHDIREERIFPIVDQLEKQRPLIVAPTK